jgi:subtilisin family serine protease
MRRLLVITAATCSAALVACGSEGSGATGGGIARGDPATPLPPASPPGGATTPRTTCTVGASGSSCVEEPPPFAPGRLVVKFRDRLAEPADVLHAHGRRFAQAATSGGEDLDRLHAAYRVRAVRPAFPWTFGGATAQPGRGAVAQRRRAMAELVARARAAYPARARRAALAADVPDLTRVFVLEADPAVDVREMARAYAANPNVEYAAPDPVGHAVAATNDPYLASWGSWGQPYEDLWGLARIGAPDAWEVSTGAGVVVAVVDTGVDGGHPDLAGNVWTNPAEAEGTPGVDDDGNGFTDDVHGWDFAEFVSSAAPGDADPTDENGHGTHVAGTIAAVGDNGVGVVGVAYGARVMPVRALDARGAGLLSNLARAIAYAASNGADVVNNSWTSPYADQAVIDAIAFARSLGCVVTAAAGNDAADVRRAFPASAPGVLAVSSSDARDGRSSFSNFGWLVDLAAPGGGPDAAAPIGAPVNVLSLRAAGTMRGLDHLFVGPGSEYVRFSGTSMAVPHVSGVAALMLAANPALGVADVEAILRRTAADRVGEPELDVAGYDPYFGWGRLDAAAAVAAAVDAASAGPPADPPVLKALPGELSFDLARGCAGEWSLPLDLYNLGGGALSWSTSGPGWLAVTPAAGTSYTPARAAVAGVADRTGVLAIDAPGAGGRVEVPVTQRTASGLTLRTCATALAQAGGNQRWDPLGTRQPSPPGVPDGAGGAIYAWTDTRARNLDVYVQRVDAFGAPSWLANGIPLAAGPNAEGRPALVGDGAGGAIVAWVEGDGADLAPGGHVRVQRIGPGGQKLWGPSGIRAGPPAGAQDLPAIVSDGAGGAIVAWGDFRSGDEDVYAQRFDGAGSPRWGDGVQVAGAPLAAHEQSAVALAEDGDGGAILAWVDRRTGFWAAYAQRLDRDGVARWAPGGVLVAPQTVRGPNVLPDGAGGAIVAWHDYRNAPPGTASLSRGDLYAQRLSAAGQALWAAGGVPVTEGLTASASSHVPGWLPDRVTMAVDGRGGAFVVWHDGREAGWDLYAQRLGADGGRLWGLRGVPVVAAPGDQLSPAVVGDGRDGAMFAWMDDRPGHEDVFVQRLGPDGAPLLAPGGVWAHGRRSDQAYPHLVPLARRRFLLAWDDENDCGYAYCTSTAVDLLGKVLELNDAPIAESQWVGAREDVPVAVTLTASDAEGDRLAYAVVTTPAHGELSGTAPFLVYTPAPDYAGPDAFTFQATDGTDPSGVATVSIAVAEVNDPPVARAQSLALAPGGPAAVILTGSDPEGSALAYEIVDPPAHGTLTGAPPNLTYEPAEGYTGLDAFTFTVSDGIATSAPAAVRLVVGSAGAGAPGGGCATAGDAAPVGLALAALAVLARRRRGR